MILPGNTLGLLGGGQLGRMFTMAARTLDYRVMVLDPDPLSPAADIANEHLCADYHDADALVRLAAECRAVTTEFENPPAESLRWLALQCLVRPSGESVAIAQDRIREKTFLAQNGFPVGPFAAVRDGGEIDAALTRVKLPALLKISRFGYDGKGQAHVASAAQARSRFVAWQEAPCVLEELLALKLEISVVLGRAADGETACFAVAENEHRNGILDVSIVPARVNAALAQRAQQLAVSVAEKLDYCGVLAVEFFVLESGELLINEIAPRPHNSGHYTLDACLTSQFEQQVRTLCGLPLGDPRLVSPVVMVNLLGDIWANGAPGWEQVLSHHNVKLHLYGKRQARPGRKMGHYTVLGDSVEAALATALEIKQALSRN
jgi:5-(carboxyamino)imidazole ribonucleotide synthase